jgi:mannose-6-phosphate isomerase
MQPRRLEPRFLEKIWGSTKTEPWFANRGQKIGEVCFDAEPLLIKFIFTTEKLSVQVHPGDDYARLHHNSRGKTEMWHILSAEPGAQIAAGLREPITANRLREAAQSGEIENLLQWFDARPGDTFFIPAGTVHAIGGGLALCEIQQHSDITYRLYDYGRPRELHLDHAVAVSHLKPHTARTDPNVSCAYFTTRRIRAPYTAHNELIATIEGSGTIGAEPIVAGEVWHVSTPATIAGEVTFLSATCA